MKYVTKNIKLAFKMISFIKSGKVVINGATINEMNEMSSEGWKYSGLGKEGITSSLEEMSRVKSIVLKDVLD